ncbi:MAG: nucleoside deaminase [Rhodomicrobium sp.]
MRLKDNFASHKVPVNRKETESRPPCQRELTLNFEGRFMEKYLDNAIEAAVNEAKTGLEEGGIPIGAVVLKGRKIIGRGHNRRLQNSDLTAHGEIDCFRNTGAKLFEPEGTTLITTLSPCRMCAGATQLAGIERVIILDQENYDDGQAEALERAGIKVEVRSHPEMIRIFKEWKEAPQNKDAWYGDGNTNKVLGVRGRQR